MSPSPTGHDELIERIVREVIRRLLAMGGPPIGGNAFGGTASGPTGGLAPVPYVITTRLITAATLESIPTGTTEVHIPAKAVLTPLARDEAKLLGIRFHRDGAAGAARPVKPTGVIR